jgi:nucleotide-binding universal stress UspA family protein
MQLPDNLQHIKSICMKTILIPTDFSDTARNAERFAAQFVNQLPETKLVLLNAYDRQGYGSDGTPLSLDATAERQIAESALYNHRLEMLAVNPAATVEILAIEGGLQQAMGQAIEQSGATMVIMGMNHSNVLDQMLVGSSTVNLVRKANLPVMIIPEDVAYKTLKNVVFASDLHDTAHSTPAAFLNGLVRSFNGRLDVVHVGQSNNTDALNDMARLLQGSAPVFHFLQDEGFTHTVNQFIERENADVLVLVTRRHDFFERIFKTSHTKVMAYHAKVPVIAVPESYCEAEVAG